MVQWQHMLHLFRQVPSIDRKNPQFICSCLIMITHIPQLILNIHAINLPPTALETRKLIISVDVLKLSTSNFHFSFWCHEICLPDLGCIIKLLFYVRYSWIWHSPRSLNYLTKDLPLRGNLMTMFKITKFWRTTISFSLFSRQFFEFFSPWASPLDFKEHF